MKHLIFILLLVPSISHAKYALEYNLLTSHLFNTCSLGNRYENQVADCGKIINNKLIGFSNSLGDDLQGRVFIGENSVGSWMFGGSYTYIGNKEGFDYGPVLGGYIQDTREFKTRRIMVAGDINGYVGLKMIIGGEAQYKVDNYKIFVIVTPVVATLGIGFDF